MEPDTASLQIYSGALYYGILIVFIVTYIGFFRMGKNVALKRKWWPRFIGLFGVLTVVKLVFFVLKPSPMTSNGEHMDKLPFVIMVAVLAGLVFVRLMRTKFCDKCSAIVRGRVTKTRKACPKCGTELASK